MKLEKIMAAILFCDVKGFSKLNEYEIKGYAENLLPKIAEKIKRYDPFYQNTWGDAIVLSFREPNAAARCALELRDFFNDSDLKEFHLPNDLKLRIALHAGVVFFGPDPIKNQDGIIGTQVNLAARIEPVTKAGEVWATEKFMKLFEQTKDEKIGFDDLGERPLAKDWGSEKLFRIRKSTELPKTITDIEEDKIQSFDLAAAALNLLKNSTDEDSRRSAVSVLGRTRHQKAIVPLIEILKNKKETLGVRIEASRALGALKATSAVPDMIGILTDVDDILSVKNDIIVSLGEIGDPSGNEILVQIIQNKRVISDTSILAALRAFIYTKNPRYVPDIIQLLEKNLNDDDICMLAAGYFDQVQDAKSIPVLLKIIKERSHLDEVRGNALMTVARIASEQCVNDLIEISKNSNEVIRFSKAVVVALAKAKTPAAMKRIEEIALDPQNPCCSHALMLLSDPKQVDEILKSK